MRTTIAVAALVAGIAGSFLPAANAAYCEVQVGQKCYVQSVCVTVTGPVHTVDDALGRPLNGIPHCID